MTQTPCALDGCNCMVDPATPEDANTDTAEGGSYCSGHCARASEDTQDGECACGHPECDA